MEQLNEISPDRCKTARNKPHHASFIYLDMGRGIWQTYVSHHQPQKSADLTIQSGAFWLQTALSAEKSGAARADSTRPSGADCGVFSLTGLLSGGKLPAFEVTP